MNKFDQWLDDKACALFNWNERTIGTQVLVAVAAMAGAAIALILQWATS